MKIALIQNGHIPILPVGERKWGAVEKILGEYKANLEKLGHEVDILYCNEVQSGQYDIVHVHVANLALDLAKRGIPYIFSLHDHHAFHLGKSSSCYLENLAAIKNSIFSICHAEYLIDYFEETDKLFFLTHGVNTNAYQKIGNDFQQSIDLLMVANNGLGGDYSFDRKGFDLAINVANRLDMHLTIIGAEANKEFFRLKNYPIQSNLTFISDNPNEHSVIRAYNRAKIFLHPSMLEAGHPNLTILEALSCETPVVGTYMGSKELPGMYVLPSLGVQDLIDGICTVRDNYEEYKTECLKIRDQFDWSIICKQLAKMYEIALLVKKEYTSEITRELYTKNYLMTSKFIPVSQQNPIKFNFHSVGGLFLEILSVKSSRRKFNVNFLDNDGNSIYSAVIGVNMWCRISQKYFVDAICRVYEGTELIYEKKFSNQIKGKRVFISFESDSLGDTIAWMPYCLEFKKKHDCDVIVSTFKNNLFKEVYPELEFVSRAKVVRNIIAQYDLGWHYDDQKEPQLPNTIPLQKAATNILGLEYKEIKPRISNFITKKPLINKYVAIATHSTAGLKEWHGWARLIELINIEGYHVLDISKEDSDYKCFELLDKSIESTMNAIHHAEFFIGLSSGLSWLAWALDKKVVMISNFSAPDHEFECIRVTNPDVCNSCWNNPLFKFDKGDWEWCPEHKGTERHFECQKSITPEMVFQAIKNNKLLC